MILREMLGIMFTLGRQTYFVTHTMKIRNFYNFWNFFFPTISAGFATGFWSFFWYQRISKKFHVPHVRKSKFLFQTILECIKSQNFDWCSFTNELQKKFAFWYEVPKCFFQNIQNFISAGVLVQPWIRILMSKFEVFLECWKHYNIAFCTWNYVYFGWTNVFCYIHHQNLKFLEFLNFFFFFRISAGFATGFWSFFWYHTISKIFHVPHVRKLKFLFETIFQCIEYPNFYWWSFTNELQKNIWILIWGTEMVFSEYPKFHSVWGFSATVNLSNFEFWWCI